MRAVILGGTGTLGQELAHQILSGKNYESVVIFSRDDHKQKSMASRFQNDPRLSFVVGDINDRASLSRVIRSGDHLFHVAALKHVDSGEDNPEQYIKVDLSGSIAVADVAIKKRAAFVVFSSTDKAVEPINVYGACKFLSERVFLHRNIVQIKTRFSVFRWGNVLGSNGSILQSFAKSLQESGVAPITDIAMTRFWIEIESAVKFMLDNFQDAPIHAPMIPPLKSAKVVDIAASIARVKKVPFYRLVETGIRKGEKIHESLISAHVGPSMCSKNYITYSPDQLDSMIRAILFGES